MRSAVSVLSPLFLAGIMLFVSVAAVLGEERSGAELWRDALREWHSIANGRTEFYVSDPTSIPSQLALAAEQSGCRYKDDIKEMPVHFISVKKQRLALVFCFGVVGSHQVFDLSDLRKPKLLEFPFLAQPNGFGTTPRPGAITWKSEASVFEAETGTDTCPSSRLRHTYRFDQALSSTAFVIVRVEVKDACDKGEWTTVWDAPLWSRSAKPSAR
jgi:hypothetical protein